MYLEVQLYSFIALDIAIMYHDYHSYHLWLTIFPDLSLDNEKRFDSVIY